MGCGVALQKRSLEGQGWRRQRAHACMPDHRRREENLQGVVGLLNKKVVLKIT